MTQRAAWLKQVMTRVDGLPPSKGLPKHRKMAVSPFVFLRGSSQLFYGDLFKGHLQLPAALDAIPTTMIMGDCHISNFGFMTEEGSHGDRIIFTPNDFDDACVGRASWDLARFCVSLDLCADHCRQLVAGEIPADTDDFSDKPHVSREDAVAAMREFLGAYMQTCRDSFDSIQSQDNALDGFKKSHILHKRYKKAVARAAGGEDFAVKSSLAKAVDPDSHPLRFRDRPGRYSRLSDALYASVEAGFAPYMDDAVLDVVERIGAGTGSVNMKRYYLLVGPMDFVGRADLPLCHIVEVKQQRMAAPLYFFGDLSPVNRLNAAHLTVTCQRRMQRDPDLILDEAEWRGETWLIRSRHHARLGIGPEDIGIGKKAVKGGYQQYGAACGRALALAHCRGDRRSVRFERTVLTHLPAAVDALIQTCLTYADLVRSDTAHMRGMLPTCP